MLALVFWTKCLLEALVLQIDHVEPDPAIGRRQNCLEWKYHSVMELNQRRFVLDLCKIF